MRVELRFNPADAVAFWLYCDQHVPSVRRFYLQRRFIRPALWLIAFSLGVLAAQMVFPSADGSALLLFVPAATLGMLLYMALYPRLRLREIKQNVNRAMQQETRYVLEPIVYEATEEGFILKHALASGTVAWDAFDEIVETPDRIFLFYEPENAYVVPRSAFSSEVDYRTFADVVARCLRQATGRAMKQVDWQARDEQLSPAAG